jgi:hypothetical protein
MANWDRIIKRHHQRAHSDDGLAFAANPGAAESDLAALEARLGIQFPAEFRSLYSTFNGFGVRSVDSPGDVYWFTRPLEELPEFVEAIRHSFRETHPELAARFYPFIDWANGDGLGYLAGDDGRILPGLYSFQHESYDCDADQDTDEFLMHAPVSLEKFLTSV